MKIILGWTLLLFSIVALGQDNFVSGYYIDQNNNKIEGFIEDVNTNNNPESINFKLALEDKSNVISISNISEFKVSTNYKYIKYIVKYDYGQVVNKSEINIYGKDPDLKKKTVLAKVIVEGEVSLLKAVINDVVFFYIKNSMDEKPRLLIHRKYNDNNKLRENNDFRKQLYDELKSEKLVMDNFTNLKYTEDELVAIFKNVNIDNNSFVEQNISVDKYKNKFYFKVIAGLSSAQATYDFKNTIGMKPVDITYTNPMFGFEFSNIFGTNSKRSEMFGRLFYQNLKSKANSHEVQSSYTVDYTLNSDISTLNFSGGYRHAIFQKGKNKVTIEGSIGYTTILSGDVTVDYLVTYTGPNANPPVEQKYLYDKLASNLFFNVGCGYVFDNKYGITLEYSPQKNYLDKYVIFEGGYSNFNLIFTYTFNK